MLRTRKALPSAPTCCLRRNQACIIGIPASWRRTGMQKIKTQRTADCVVGGFRYLERSTLLASGFVAVAFQAGRLCFSAFLSGRFQSRAVSALLTPFNPSDRAGSLLNLRHIFFAISSPSRARCWLSFRLWSHDGTVATSRRDSPHSVHHSCHPVQMHLETTGKW